MFFREAKTKHIDGVWSYLSSGKRVPLDAEAVQYLVKIGRGKQINPEWLGNLPGRWLSCKDDIKLPFDRTASEIALGLGWDHLVCQNEDRLFSP